MFKAILWIVALGLMPLAHGAEETPLQHGSVATYDFGSITLHAYQTGDAMADECFALETATGVVAIESPAFAANIEEWKHNLDGLNKPLTDIFLSYHPTGGKWYGAAVSHATASAQNAMNEGGARQLVDTLKKAFGEEFSDDIPDIDKTLAPGPNRVGGLEFIVTDNGDGYDIAIPAIKAVYLHMLGAKVHSILTSPEHIAATIRTLEGFKADGYTLFLSSHHTPETLADVDEKIAYLAKTGEIAGKSANRADFIQRMKAAYPAYSGENYLEMTAGALFEK